MAIEMKHEAVCKIKALTHFLRSVREDQYGQIFDQLAEDLFGATGTDDGREVVHRGLAMFAGMNSFNDLVIMDGMVADSVNSNRLDELRTDVFDALVRLIGR